MADTKISALPANTTPADTDLIPIVDDPAGTPATERMTLATLKTFVQASLGSRTTTVAAANPNTANSTYGTQLTSGAAHTKGDWVELVASTSFAAETLTLTFHEGVAGSGTAPGMLLDIGIGAAAAETVLVPDLLCGFISATASGVLGALSGLTFIIPIAVAAGTRISARVQAIGASDTTTVGLRYRASGFCDAPGVTCTAMGVSSSGATTGTSPTTVVSTNTKGDWTQIIASTASTYRYLMVAMQATSTSSTTAGDGLVDIGIGAAAAETAIIADLAYVISSTEIFAHRGAELPFKVAIPAGSRLSCRYACSSTNAAAKPVVALYGFT